MPFNPFPVGKIVDKTEQYDIFLRWWLFFSLICLGVLGLWLAGLLQKINQGDITKISFLIFAVFTVITIRTGKDTYRFCREDRQAITLETLDRYEKRNELGWFMSDIFLTLGMIGTVIGFIYMLGTSFAEINPSDTTSMQGVLAQMSTGMSTALYTTAAGLVCSLLLKLQLFNLAHQLEGLRSRT